MLAHCGEGDTSFIITASNDLLSSWKMELLLTGREGKTSGKATICHVNRIHHTGRSAVFVAGGGGCTGSGEGRVMATIKWQLSPALRKENPSLRRSTKMSSIPFPAYELGNWKHIPHIRRSYQSSQEQLSPLLFIYSFVCLGHAGEGSGPGIELLPQLWPKLQHGWHQVLSHCATRELPSYII